MSTLSISDRARDAAHHLGIPEIAPLTPCGAIFYPQPICFLYFAREIPPILMKTRIWGRGEGGTDHPRKSHFGKVKIHHGGMEDLEKRPL